MSTPIISKQEIVEVGYELITSCVLHLTIYNQYIIGK